MHIYSPIFNGYTIPKREFSDGCPLVIMKEGGAYEHNGSSHIVVTHIYSTVLHRQP